MSRCKNRRSMLDESRHNARCRSQYSLPAKLLSKLVEIYIDENSGPMHVPPAGWITARQRHQYRIKESYHILGRRNIPDICHERHEYIRVNFFLVGVNFNRFNAKNWQFTVYFAVITQKLAIFCVFCRNLRVFSV